ncbi:MAG TPA: NAD(P)/FAD-dependent oxidoreductase [Sandaracinaceae bacterium LLY-WYZ-13_1]|nr:NAD(P)/FAD-dependent oxidoreductase [Sandaracinaceae bacterium LLY-WYZ-13_1]
MTQRVAIVGGGPAGSALALNLLARGVDPDDLVILDKARFPRPKLCGGALTFRGTEALGALIGEPDGGARTVGLEFRSALGCIDVFERGGQWIYDRGLLDDRLLGAVKDAGVEVREGEAVSSLDPGVDRWRVGVGERVETFSWVCGADGACGISRRASKLRGGILGRLVEAVYEPIGEAPDPSRLYFDFDPVLDGIPGYAWIFPYPKPGHDRARYWKLGIMDGRGRVPGRELRAWTDRFAARHGFRCVEDKLTGWPERYYDTGARGHRPGLFLVGEAFGIDPLLGEGIAPALHHAAYAARRLKEALDAGTDRVRGYERGFLCTLEGRNLWFQARLADRLYGPRGIHWMRVLFDLPRLGELAGAGDDAYGRLTRRIPSLASSYLWRLATRGLPPNRVPAAIAEARAAGEATSPRAPRPRQR